MTKMDDREKEIEKNWREFDRLQLLTELRFKRLKELKELEEPNEKNNPPIENQLTEEMRRWVDKLPPLPPGWEYEISPEYMYNPARDCYDIKLTATPRQRYLIKED